MQDRKWWSWWKTCTPKLIKIRSMVQSNVLHWYIILLQTKHETLGLFVSFKINTILIWCHGVVVITTAQLHLKKPEPTFCLGSNPTHG